MIDTRLSMARLALEQLSRKDRLALVRDLGLIQSTNAGPAPEARLLRRTEVARRLSVSLRTVDKWAKQGLITKRKLAGRRRASGFSSLEIDQLILRDAAAGGPG